MAIVIEKFIVKQRKGESPDIIVTHRHPEQIVYERIIDKVSQPIKNDSKDKER